MDPYSLIDDAARAKLNDAVTKLTHAIAFHPHPSKIAQAVDEYTHALLMAFFSSIRDL